MTFSCYVGGSSREVERVQRVQRAVEALGGVITADWTPSIAAEIARGVPEHELLDHEAAEIAEFDAEGVFSAQVLLFCVPTKPNTTQGGWWELGFACGIVRVWQYLEGMESLATRVLRPKPHVVCSGPDVRRSLFTRWRDTAAFESDVDAIEYLAVTMHCGEQAVACAKQILGVS